MIENIGFMQGRLSPIIGGRIQSFPWECWQQEIGLANKLDIKTMEWTLDYDRLYENPLMTKNGQREIVSLCKANGFSIPSLTGDCFMQAPFWKVNDVSYRQQLKNDFKSIVRACSNVGIELIVIPLVDGGSLENYEQEMILIDFLLQQQPFLKEIGLRIIFESDFSPAELNRFITQFDKDIFGINYDIGNSASLGLCPEEEFSFFGDRILNVHVKDRLLGGTTVPLGDGHADFCNVYRLLKSLNYRGNYILQTARADDDNHSEVLLKYKRFVQRGFK